MSQYKIAPSILAADYANFEREIWCQTLSII